MDLTFALRQLRRSPTFTLVAVATLALGVGANTAIFSVLADVALRPLPYPEPNRLVRVWPQQVFTKAMLVEFAEQSRSVPGMAGYQENMYTLTGGAQPEEVAGASVSPGYFGILGVEPALGRGFTKDEENPGRGDVVVLSWGLW
ncbi:MAG: ABC transporter permease, partial [Gemmatimonadota bacterium]